MSIPRCHRLTWTACFPRKTGSSGKTEFPEKTEFPAEPEFPADPEFPVLAKPEPEVACLSWAVMNPEQEVSAKPEYPGPEALPEQEAPGPELDRGLPTGPEPEEPGPEVMLRDLASDPAIAILGRGT